MAIIVHIDEENIRYAYLNIFPDQFLTEKEKQTDSWKKVTMDYFGNKAYSEYKKNKESFEPNYDLVKGILRPEDFYMNRQIKSFVDTIIDDKVELPAYVKHFSILTTPVNTLGGEMSKRPDGHKFKAFDDDSRSEELEFKTQMMQQFIKQEVEQKVMEQFQMQGQEPKQEDVDKLTMEKISDYMVSYTTMAEKWANHMLEALKMEFNIKEKSEDGFRDLIITAREYFHIYEDNSKLGFNLELMNPKNVWFMSTPDRKYTSDQSGRGEGSYASGTVEVMEISELIEKFPELTKEEIDHLRLSMQNYGLINVRESNLDNPNISGNSSIIYDTYDPAVLRARQMLEGEIKENSDTLQDFLGLSSNVSTFGYKYVVVRAYWQSKKMIGKVTFQDEQGEIQSLLVDENYKKGTVPGEISLEWGWVNQWYKGTKIGPDIYHVEPYKLLPYNPIIGVNFELKNTETKSIVDMMKPFQVLYNICMNQIYRLLEKEIGNVGVINIRRVPRVKDGDGQDDIEVWEMEARERGIMFDDDSPENTKGGVTNQSVARNIDLSRTSEIQARYNLASVLKTECYELIGINRQRQGQVLATETATGTNTAMTQSYAQTEPLFVAHEYLLNQVFQALIDAALYIESNKPQSTIAYINSQGEHAFVQVNGDDLKMRDLKVYATSRPEDIKMFNEIRGLSQAVLQNGGSLNDIINLYSETSIRSMKNIFKKLDDEKKQFQQQEQEQKQQEIEQQQKQFEAQQETEERRHQEDLQMRKYEIDTKASTDIAKAQIATYFQNPALDVNNNGVSDINDIANRELKARDILTKTDLQHQKMSFEMQKMLNENTQKEKDRQAELKKSANDVKIAKIHTNGKTKK